MEIIRKYRPQTLDDVIGQNHVVTSLRSVLKKQSSKAFLLSGPPGTGKTSIARIIAKSYGVDETNVLEIDGATYTGIDNIRAVLDQVQFAGLGGNGRKMVIVDECQAISKAAFSALLKTVEEPPAHLMWAFCTTDLEKVPLALRNRCTQYVLQHVKGTLLCDFLAVIAKREDIKVNAEVIETIARFAAGSVRKALVGLLMCADCSNARQAAKVLSSPTDDAELVDLMRLMADGALKWGDVRRIYPKLTGEAEGCRIVICNYMAKVALFANNRNTVINALRVLDTFSKPYPQGAGMYCLLIGLAEIVFGDK